MVMVSAARSCEMIERCVCCAGRLKGICSVVSQGDLSCLAFESSRVTVPSGRCFIEEGAPAHDFFIISSGRAKLFTLLPDGRRQITCFAEAGEFLGLAAAERYAFGAEALGEIVLCRFPHASMERLIVRFPQLEHRLREEASRELVRTQGWMTLLGRKTARERLATFLIERCRTLNRTQPFFERPVQISLMMSRTDIADYLGLTIETVSRTISIFKREGLIEVRGITAVTLLKPEQILAIAEGMA